MNWRSENSPGIRSEAAFPADGSLFDGPSRGSSVRSVSKRMRRVGRNVVKILILFREKKTIPQLLCPCRFSGRSPRLPPGRTFRPSSSEGMSAISTSGGLLPTSTSWSWAAVSGWPRSWAGNCGPRCPSIRLSARRRSEPGVSKSSSWEPARSLTCAIRASRRSRRGRSKTTSGAATLPSMRWPGRSRRRISAAWSILSTGCGICTRESSARRATRMSPFRTIRCG